MQQFISPKPAFLQGSGLLLPALLLTVLLPSFVLPGCSAEQATDEIADVSQPAERLAAEIRNGDVSSEALVGAYLDRIAALDTRGPELRSVLALNPNAQNEARQRDLEAKDGRLRGALHGVPVLVKDNIETRELPTTAGSRSLADNATGRDAPLIARLRAQGAVILGKTNLSEWANFRSDRAIAGWSAVGGQTRNPYALDRSPCGSSSGSAVAVAALFAPLAIGTETNGSITCPAAMNGVVGMKPTVGLVSRTHVIPISDSQDSAGPLARSVRDAALLLSVMAGSDPLDHATRDADARKADYLSGIEDGIGGFRIGVFRWAEGRNAAVSAAFAAALAELEAEGATLIDIHEFSPAPVMWTGGETLLQTEFKHGLNAYLQSAADAVTIRSIDDLIAFNEAHADEELALFDQSTLIAAAKSPAIDDPAHVALVADIRAAARQNGIDRLLETHDVEVLIMPSAAPAPPLDPASRNESDGPPVGATWLAAMAGYPALSVPMGSAEGLPLGLLIVGKAWDDATVLRVGRAYERAADPMPLAPAVVAPGAAD